MPAVSIPDGGGGGGIRPVASSSPEGRSATDAVRGIIDREGQGYDVKVLLVIDGNTGQNGLSQAKAFTEAVKCDGVMLTKLDSTAKGGIALAIADDLGLPVWFAGTGEKAEDFAEFDAAGFADTILPQSIAS